MSSIVVTVAPHVSSTNPKAQIFLKDWSVFESAIVSSSEDTEATQEAIPQDTSEVSGSTLARAAFSDTKVYHDILYTELARSLPIARREGQLFEFVSELVQIAKDLTRAGRYECASELSRVMARLAGMKPV